MENLPKERELSNIPSQQGSWYYPSPQQFYRASVAKGHDVNPNDMEVVVAIHNAVNERAWFEIQRFESKFHPECSNPRLIRFVGKPGEQSLKARIRSAFGTEPPFDRHDWFVDRCGTNIRYIVDFYDGQPTPSSPISMFVDARPALEAPSAIWDRLRMSWLKISGQKI